MSPLPEQFAIILDPTTQIHDGGRLLFGGARGIVLRLSNAGAKELARMRSGAALSPAARRLARRLIDAGLGHPVPPRRTERTDVTAVVPVRDRPAALDRCLAALGKVPTVVVDDGSFDPDAVAEVCRAHNARLLSRGTNGGPAAARNTALAHVDTTLVAFVDSDCIPPDGWIAALAGHFDDPLVAAVAPRIRPKPTADHYSAVPTLAQYLEDRCPLDLGSRPAAVYPLSAVQYVPTAALLVRQSALGEAFDEHLRYGEDVDFVWRLHDAGWRVRYDPSVIVYHDEPRNWRAMVARRFRYGMSAGPLARRHPRRLPSAAIHPLPTLIVIATLLRRPLVAAVIGAVGTASVPRTLHRAGIPPWRAFQLVLQASLTSYRNMAHAAVALYSPALVAALIGSGRRRRIAALLITPFLLEWLERQPPLDPMRWIVARIIDDVAYGAGVWWGCVGARTSEPLRPVTRRFKATPQRHGKTRPL